MANPTTTAITCTYCFNLPDGTYRDHKSKADLLPISGLRERRLQCPGCKLLCEAIEKCEKFLRGKEKDPNFQFETFKVTTRSNCRSFSKCTLIFQHGIYELIFGEDESACNPFLGRLPTDRENFHVDAANKWISRCQKSHKACRRDQPAPLPRRVIYVGSGDQNLYESKGEAIPYAALSHCWADSLPYHDDTRQQAQSTTSNLSQHKRRLVWNNLPLAFKESICIVRKLGIQYLWIDSLCILQDDAEDWELESGRMANIYQNSAVTIMLHQRKPGDTSLLTTRYSFQLGFNGSPISFQFRSLGEEDTAIEQSRIFQRGWCFQVSPKGMNKVKRTSKIIRSDYFPLGSSTVGQKAYTSSVQRAIVAIWSVQRSPTAMCPTASNQCSLSKTCL
jgi:hypothetical protein